MTFSSSLSVVSVVGLLSGVGAVFSDDTLSHGQQWTLIGLLAAVLAAVWKAATGIGNRMADVLAQNTKGLSEQSARVGEHTAKVGELVVELRAMAAQSAMHQRESDKSQSELMARLTETISRVPNQVADELQQRKQKQP